MPAYIHSISTAVPAHVASQEQIAQFMIGHLQLEEAEERKVRLLYRASGIGQRYSVLPDFSQSLNGKGFFQEKAFPSIKPRMELFQQSALQLGVSACADAIEKASLNRSDITHLIVVSCTGMYAPGMDIELIEQLGLATNIERTAINFMGCYAAFNALKVASHIVKQEKEASVLVLCAELCSIHLQDAVDDDSLLSNAIFGDGAAAVIVSGKKRQGSLELVKFHSDLALQGKSEMGWFIGDNGFEMKLSTKVPAVIEQGIGELTDRLLAKTGLAVGEIAYFAIHPGGKKILDVIEQKLGLTKEQNKYAYEVLKKYGNMSSPTVLFVLHQILQTLQETDDEKHILSFAFGPGLTLESAILKAHLHA